MKGKRSATGGKKSAMKARGPKIAHFACRAIPEKLNTDEDYVQVEETSSSEEEEEPSPPPRRKNSRKKKQTARSRRARDYAVAAEQYNPAQDVYTHQMNRAFGSLFPNYNLQ